MQILNIAIFIAYLYFSCICFIKTFSLILFSLKTDLLVSLDMDCISSYQPLPQKPRSIMSTFSVLMDNKLNNAMFSEISIYEFVKPSDMGSQLFKKSVFLFLESASKLNANSGKHAFFALDVFNFNDFRLHTHKL